MISYLTSKTVERETNLSGSYLRKLVREGRRNREEFAFLRPCNDEPRIRS